MSYEEEQERPAFPFGFAIRPPTPEEIAHAKEEQAKAMGEGNIKYETLRQFNPEATCLKCGQRHTKILGIIPRDMDVHYISEGKFAYEHGEHDVLALTCRRCHYVELQKCLGG